MGVNVLDKGKTIMNRRKFMKALGIAVCAVTIPASSAKGHKGPIPADLSGFDIHDIPGLTEPCEGSFIPEWDEYVGYVSGEVMLFNIQNITLNWAGLVNSHEITLLTKDQGPLVFPPDTLLFTGVSGQRDNLSEPFKAKYSLVRKKTGSFNDVFQVYERGNFGNLLSSVLWTEIKEYKQ